MSISKLTLGTVQLGLDYGINNKKGKPSIEESLNILNYAYDNGVTSFDSAKAYGNSEEIIGQWVKKRQPKDIFVSTKISSIYKQEIKDNDIKSFLYTNIQESQEKLCMHKISNLYLHDFRDLVIYKDNIINNLKCAKYDKLIDNIGVSVYEPSEMQAALDYEIDIIQIPTNIFDHRFITKGLIEKAKKKNVKVFSRSAFLQGLFFMDEEEIPKKLEDSIDYIKKLKSLSHKYNRSIEEIVLAFLKNTGSINSVLIGVDNINQLKKNITYFNSDIELDYKYILDEFGDIDNKIIDPRKW